jgi:hypothetical protein
MLHQARVERQADHGGGLCGAGGGVMRLRQLIGLMLALASAALAPCAGAADEVVIAPAEHRRTPDQTFLTFPEWYLVHSPAEYATYLGTSARPSRFPLFEHIGQFWQGYAAVSREISRYPFNGGYHLMVMVIGTSTTVEYTLKGLYEHTIGRLTEATTSKNPVPEEAFAARYAQDYVDFIRVDPWYKFDFLAQLRKLWVDTPWSGPNLLRRWERRFALTTELLVKEGYARLIKLGTQSIYDAPKPVTHVVLSKAPAPDAAHPDYLPQGAAPPEGTVAATIPRYEGFTTYSRWLAAQGVDFVEIAGNRGEVVVSLLVPPAWRPDDRTRTLFVQPVLTRPGTQRMVLATPITNLGALLRQAGRSDVPIEHVYDF